MTSEEKIYKVLEKIKEKIDISPVDSIIEYRAGFEVKELPADDEIKILNKLENEEIVEVVYNAGSEYV